MGDRIRLLVRGFGVGPALGIAFVWVTVGLSLNQLSGWMTAYFATVPIVFLAAAFTAATRWVVHVDDSGIDLVTEPFPLPFVGWSLPREAVAFVSIDERVEDADIDGWNWSLRHRTWAVVITARSGRNLDVATRFDSADQAKDLADRIRRTMRL